MLTQARLHEVLSYDPESGEFYWRNSPTARIPAGARAGTPHNRGYRQILVDARRYLSHRLAWLYTFGVWPDEVDHINGVKDDNRIANLRDVSHAQNQRNMKLRKDSSTGIKNVFQTDGGKWCAYITLNGKRKHLGTFGTSNLASQAYEAAATELFGEYRHAA
jgi:hypothetical protein